MTFTHEEIVGGIIFAFSCWFWWGSDIVKHITRKPRKPLVIVTIRNGSMAFADKGKFREALEADTSRTYVLVDVMSTASLRSDPQFDVIE